VPTLDEMLGFVGKHNCSDLHLKAGSTPTVRLNGDLARTKWHALSSSDIIAVADEMMDDDQRIVLKDKGEVDFAYSTPGVGRFRVNIHRQRGSLAIAMRRILPGAPEFNTLNLPQAVEELANEHRGLMLVTGPTSSGKTTTTGAVINHINSTRACHILTIEDPIEILHEDRRSFVTQREIGPDTGGFGPALRAAMRQDPDVIFVGEIRDLETVRAALQAAETGHFVVATLHTTNVAETVTRIIDMFPGEQQNQVRLALAGSLIGVVSQRLLPRESGGRVAAIEILINNGRVRDCIQNPEQTHLIHDIVEESSFYGMQTFDQSLIQLYKSKMVSLEDAMTAASRPHDFKLALQQEGLQPV
jgi:twitching motility protein PilT